MRRYCLRGLVSAFFFFLFYSNLLFAYELNVPPSSYLTQKGSTGEQAVTALALKDQSEFQDNWESYVEFYTPGVVYKGQRTYKIPSQVNLQDIEALQLQLNFKGPQKSYQQWSWKIYDYVNKAWVFIGDNAFAASWKWQEANFQITGPVLNYVGSNREIKILFQSNNAKDDADLDYEALVLTIKDEVLPVSVDYWTPNLQSSWQWQFTGLPIDTSINADIFSLDLFDTDVALIQMLKSQGKNVVCYINMGSWENWRPDANQFPSSIKGRSNGWPGEKWLDIRQTEVLLPLLEARMDLCKAKGFDAIEPDNIDGYTNRSGFPLTYQDQLQFNQMIAQAAHERGLAIGLKNDLNQINDLLHDFDFAINESCYQYSECHMLSPFVNVGKAVFQVEYEAALEDFCPQSNELNFNAMKKNRLLDAYREGCR